MRPSGPTVYGRVSDNRITAAAEIFSDVGQK
jgi:hypothetical protein